MSEAWPMPCLPQKDALRTINVALGAIFSKDVYFFRILSIIFVIGDKALFIANQSPDSKVTIMTLLKQAGCIVTILAGKFVFKEKNIGYKLFCAGVIITGIVLSVAM